MTKDERNLERELDEYRKAFDKTLFDLQKVVEVRSRKAEWKMIVLGISLVGVGGVMITYIPSLDIYRNQAISLFGALGIFAGISVAFLGYLLAHKGFIGHWR